MNLKVRVKNPVFWVQIVLSIFNSCACVCRTYSTGSYHME